MYKGCVEPVECEVYIEMKSKEGYTKIIASTIKEAAQLVHGIKNYWIIATKNHVRVITRADIQNPNITMGINKSLRKTVMKQMGIKTWGL